MGDHVSTCGARNAARQQVADGRVSVVRARSAAATGPAGARHCSRAKVAWCAEVAHRNVRNTAARI